MKAKWLLVCGVLAPIVYVSTVIVGGLIRPGYSHLSEPISELTATGAPNKGLLDLLFLAYNLLVMAFGVGLAVKANGSRQGRLSGLIAGVALVATGACGALLQLFFPQDPGGAQAAVTTTGTMHIVFAGLAALTTMVAVLFSALWFRLQRTLKGYVVYSLVTLVVIAVSGGYGAASASASGNALFGLVERVTIGAMELWLLVVSLKLYRGTADSNEAEALTPSRHAAGD